MVHLLKETNFIGNSEKWDGGHSVREVMWIFHFNSIFGATFVTKLDHLQRFFL